MATLINTLLLSLVLVISFMSSRSSTVQGLPFPIPSFSNCNNFEGCCPPPYNQTFKHFYKFDTKLPVRTRRPAHLLDDAYIAKYQKAYELLRALPDSDGRSWKNQAKLHCAYCDAAFFFPKARGNFEVHYSWVFFPWHRFFLYFHERILAKLLNDDTFALPFWEWDNQSPEPPLANSIPEVYVNPTYQNKESSLYDVNRNPCAYPPNVMDLQLVTECRPQTPGFQAAIRGSNNRLMYNQVVTGAPVNRLFFGEAYRLEGWPGLGAGTIEGFPHGTVHDWTGDPSAKYPTSDMGNFRYSAYDPIFYAHHGNIDRLWDLWKSLPGDYRNDLTDPDYLNTEFLFYNENGDLVKVKIAQALDIGNSLRYNYENVSNSWLQDGSDAAFPSCYPASKSEINKLIHNTPPLDTSNITTFANSTITFRVRRPAKSINNNSKGEEVLVIGGLNISSTRFIINAFLFFPTAVENTTISCPQFFGKLSNSGLIFGVDLPDPDKEWRLAITPKLRNLGLDNVSHVVVTLVQLGMPQYLQFKTAKIKYFQ
jgi:polyphenol oxidase